MRPRRGCCFPRGGARPAEVGDRRRGTTLVELLIAMGLLSLLLAAIYTITIGTVKDYIKESSTIELEQGALTALGRLSLEMAETDPARNACVAGTSPKGVVFVSPRTASGTVSYDSAGVLIWQQYVCYYVKTVNGTSCLVRASETLPTPTSMVSSIAAKATSDFTGKPCNIVVSNVDDFTVTTSSKPFAVSLTCSRSVLGNTDRLQVDTRIWARN